MVDERQALEAGESGELSSAIQVARGEVSSRVQKTLKMAASGKEPVKVDKVDIIDPASAYENLQKALSAVHEHFPFNENDLYFRQFPGNTVGEAKEGGKVEVDPIMLMHPANRLAHVVLHELSHKGGEVENEGVVEAYTQELLKASGMVEGEALQTTDKYDFALENFYEFARRVYGEGRESDAVRDIYKLYYTGNYESIYGLYKDNYMEGLKSDAEKDEAFSFFERVFPELEVHDDGWYGVCDVQQAQIDEVEASVRETVSDVQDGMPKDEE